MDDNLKRPKFLPSFFRALAKSAERRSWRSIVPTWLVVALCVGAAASYLIPATFWNPNNLSVSTAVYVGLLTLNGLILALSWNAFSRIYEIISAPRFSAYLAKSDLLNGYIVFTGFVHVTQLAAVVVSAAGLLLLLIDRPAVIYDRIAFAAMVSASAYAIKMAAGAVTVMHDLLWQKAIFDEYTSRGENVVPFGKSSEDNGA